MRKVTTIIIGAGQAGLAMSYHLSKLSVDHLLLERGQVANSWIKERWDSLRLLTPNWQSRLPGYQYTGDNPDGYRTMVETVGFLQDYADAISAPVLTNTKVYSVDQREDGYLVSASNGLWLCKSVVIASGACNIANVPAFAADLHGSIRSLTPFEYRNPSELENGGVLVVGASATGVQLAQELQMAGHQVTMAVGEHVRTPRTYRERDIKWWMDTVGFLDLGIDEVDDATRARHVPSMQLIGSPNRQTISLNSLQALGVKITGRLTGLSGTKAQFSGSLANVCALADLKMNRLLQSIDDFIDAEDLPCSQVAPYRLRPTNVPDCPQLQIDMAQENIKTIIWATGFRPDYRWLNVPVIHPRGYLRHQGGVVDAPGLYAMGLPFMRRRKSTLIDGVGDDAAELSDHLKGFLDENKVKAA